MVKEKIQNAMIGYARKVYRKSGKAPTKKDIRREFRAEVYNYFKNMKDLCLKAGIRPSSRALDFETRRKIVIDFVKNCAKNRKYPTQKDMQNKFGLQLRTYFRKPPLLSVYKEAKVEYSKVLGEIKKRIGNARKKRNAYETVEEGREAISKYINRKVASGRYPGVLEIQRSLKMAFYRYFKDIHGAYEYANVKYDRPCPIVLGRKKEVLMTNIAEKIFRKMGYRIIRVSIKSKEDCNSGPDMVLKDNSGNMILVEIKAYRKNQYITVREMNQLRKYLEQWNVKRGILLTTSESERGQTSNILFINGAKLKSLLKRHGFVNEIGNIVWIENAEVTRKEVIEHRNMARKSIIEYVRSQRHIPTKTEIERTLSLDTRSCFSSLREIYEMAGVELPNTVLTKEEIRNKVMAFIRERAKTGVYPNSQELHKKFGINLGTYFGSGNIIEKTYTAAGIHYRGRSIMFPLSSSAYNEPSRLSSNPSLCQGHRAGAVQSRCPASLEG